MITALLGFAVGIALALVGWSLNRLQAVITRRDEQRQAAAAFRFELETNLLWLQNVLGSLNYLRDEAWIKMKNEGYASYLKRPIPVTIIQVYDELHRFNHNLKLLKEREPSAQNWLNKEAPRDADGLASNIKALIHQLDSTYPEIARNFAGD
ncbi:MAG: hypothetical protein WEC75_01185 [Dehalococcoidia bacterium]